MAYTIHKPSDSLEDQALPATVLTSKSHSRIIDGTPSRMSSSLRHHDIALHSKNDLTVPTSDQSKQSDGRADISGYSLETAENNNTPSERFRRGAETPNLYTTSSSYTEACHSTFNVTASENLNASFQRSALDELPKPSDQFRVGNNFGSPKSDALERRDHVLGLESSSFRREDGQGTPDNKRLSNSRPITEDVGTLQEHIQTLLQNGERTMQQLLRKEEENSKLKNEVFVPSD